jgi:hypothetical protein
MGKKKERKEMDGKTWLIVLNMEASDVKGFVDIDITEW